MEKIVKNWIATSNYDLKTAEAMLKAGRYIIATRYPEDLRRLSEEFNQEAVKMIFSDTKRVIRWIKKKIT